jgi:hypothetical protein
VTLEEDTHDDSVPTYTVGSHEIGEDR